VQHLLNDVGTKGIGLDIRWHASADRTTQRGHCTQSH
jgi:hypothetical protein